VDVQVELHAQNLPEVLPVSPHIEHSLPAYDMEALLIEVELLLDWYLPRMGANLTASARDVFIALWRDALQPAIDSPSTWVLRDYHSPNLIWLPEREGIARVGLLDFQDALMGPAAYDLASLLQDARVDVPEEMEINLISRYVRDRHARDPDFDVAGFIRLYATMAGQRATKILGIFARLDLRDGKPQYLRHMPRIWAYLQRALAHPAQAPLKAWYDSHVPALKTI
jgi:aminoglycoside/choline kinase family phosphotransferase